MSMADLQPHEFCLLADDLEPSELAKLESSMRENGYDPDMPVKLFEGKILDGRHRYATAKRLGLYATFSEFIGTRQQALEYAYFSLFGRRHFQKGQKAAIAIRFNEKRTEIGEQEMTHEELAKATNISIPYISQASSVNKRDPEALDRVISGELSLAKAYKELEGSVPERVDERDPLFDVWITRDRWKMVIARLTELAERDIDPLQTRRGSEVIRDAFTEKVREHGVESLGKTFLMGLIARIKANMPEMPCEECQGEGCGVCGRRGWWTITEAKTRRKK